MDIAHTQKEPLRADIDTMPGSVVLEFGTSWCGYCRAAQPLIGQALAARGGVRHIKIEDGSGRPLGRSFGVKLWPTLVFLQDGREQGRLVRPQTAEQLRQALDRIAPGP